MSHITAEGDPIAHLRIEAKFKKVTVSDLVEYFTSIDKRMAWDGANFESLEEVRSFPVKTSLCYIKLKKVKGQPQRDCLMLSHKIELVGDRVYLLSGSVSHSAFAAQKGTQRIDSPFSFNYFEPSYDGTGVKNIYICLTNPKVLQA